MASAVMMIPSYRCSVDPRCLYLGASANVEAAALRLVMNSSYAGPENEYPRSTPAVVLDQVVDSDRVADLLEPGRVDRGRGADERDHLPAVLRLHLFQIGPGGAEGLGENHVRVGGEHGGDLGSV